MQWVQKKNRLRNRDEKEKKKKIIFHIIVTVWLFGDRALVIIWMVGKSAQRGEEKRWILDLLIDSQGTVDHYRWEHAQTDLLR